MPFNLSKAYADLLDIGYLPEQARRKSLRGIFDRDFQQGQTLSMRGKPVYPLPHAAPVDLDPVFWHLISCTVPGDKTKRDYESERACRLHWVKPHLEETVPDPLLVFETDEGGEDRLYILNKKEKYLVVLNPLRKVEGYYLLTAYHLGDDSLRKMMRKYERVQRALSLQAKKELAAKTREETETP